MCVMLSVQQELTFEHLCVCLLAWDETYPPGSEKALIEESQFEHDWEVYTEGRGVNEHSVRAVVYEENNRIVAAAQVPNAEFVDWFNKGRITFVNLVENFDPRLDALSLFSSKGYFFRICVNHQINQSMLNAFASFLPDQNTLRMKALLAETLAQVLRPFGDVVMRGILTAEMKELIYKTTRDFCTEHNIPFIEGEHKL